MGVADELTALLGPASVATDPVTIQSVARDRSAAALIARRSGATASHADAVARPTSVDEVSEFLRWANSSRVPVYPRGGGSGVCRALEAADGVVLDLRGLDSIVDIDERSHSVVAQAGVAGTALDGALRARGLMLGHEPQSIAISTVGGWVATAACGQLSAAYGGIDALVTGLRAVLPGGHVAKSKPAPRRATGPDVSRLMIGSEGTLGAITDVALRVASVPAERTNGCVGFAHMADGVAACRQISQSDLHPSVVRLYDRDDAGLLLRNLSVAPEGPVLLLSFDGLHSGPRTELALEMCAAHELDPGIVDHWWQHRNDAVEEYERTMTKDGLLGAHGVVDTMELAAPWSRLRDLYHAMKDALLEVADFAGCHLSHVYPDGACLYFTLASSCAGDDAALRALNEWWEVGMSTCLAHGGTISHHHGIGRLKSKWLPRELGGWWEVLRAIKGVVDPHRIMNPGALGL